MRIRLFLLTVVFLLICGCLPHAKRIVIFPAVPCTCKYCEAEKPCSYYFYHIHYQTGVLRHR